MSKPLIEMTDEELADERAMALDAMQWADLEYANSSSSFVVQRAKRCSQIVGEIDEEIFRRQSQEAA